MQAAGKQQIKTVPLGSELAKLFTFLKVAKNRSKNLFMRVSSVGLAEWFVFGAR